MLRRNIGITSFSDGRCNEILRVFNDSLVEISISARMQEERPAVCTVYYAASSCTS